MTKLKKITAIGITALIMGATAFSAFASSSENATVQGNQAGAAYGMMANGACGSEEFKEELLAMKEEALAKKVAAGTMTQERADEIIAAIKEHQADCDGEDCTSERIGQSLGAGFGMMGGMGGQNNAAGCQNGTGNRQGGAGAQGLCDGSCNVE